MGLLAKASVAIDGSKFQGGEQSLTTTSRRARSSARQKQLEESVARYMSQLRHRPTARLPQEKSRRNRCC